jgi:structure-specific recognition protein 1
MSSFLYFLNENRARIKEENPDAGFGGLGKLAGEEWRALTAAEKKPYEKMNTTDQKR